MFWFKIGVLKKFLDDSAWLCLEKLKKHDFDTSNHKNNKQQKIDHILDKINESGYDSLTNEEKRTLNEASKD